MKYQHFLNRVHLWSDPSRLYPPYSTWPNWSCYEQPLQKKKLQRTLLQLYIKHIEGFIWIVDILSVRRQDYQWKALILCRTLLQVNYLPITTTFNKKLLSKHKKHNIQAKQKLYSSICLHIQTTQCKPCFISMIKCLEPWIIDMINNMNIWSR